MVKIIQRLIVVLMLWALPCQATLYWIDLGSGNDANDGLTEGNPKKTFVDTFNDYATQSDTIIVWGTTPDDKIEPGVDDSGVEDAHTLIISKAVYEGNWQRSVTDTTIIWDNEIKCSTDYSFTIDDDDDYIDFMGIYFRGNRGYGTGLISGGDSCRFYQCKLREMKTVSVQPVLLYTTNASIGTFFYNCIFLEYYGEKSAIYPNVSGTEVNLVNCTIYGNFTYSAIGRDGAGRIYNIHNCIITSLGVSSAYKLFYGSVASASFDLDYNIWWDYAENYTNPWVFSDRADCSMLSEWKTVMQTFNVNNAVHSLHQNPNLQYVSTTCVPSIPVTGEDLGYGTTIGWYQSLDESSKPIIIRF